MHSSSSSSTQGSEQGPGHNHDGGASEGGSLASSFVMSFDAGDQNGPREEGACIALIVVGHKGRGGAGRLFEWGERPLLSHKNKNGRHDHMSCLSILRHLVPG